MIIELSSLQKSAIFLAGECYWLNFCSSWLDIGQVHFFVHFTEDTKRTDTNIQSPWLNKPVVDRGEGTPLTPLFFRVRVRVRFFWDCPPSPPILESGWPLPSLSEALHPPLQANQKELFSCTKAGFCSL